MSDEHVEEDVPAVPMSFRVVLDDQTYELGGVLQSGIADGFLILLDRFKDQWSFNIDRVVYFTMRPDDE